MRAVVFGDSHVAGVGTARWQPSYPAVAGLLLRCRVAALGSGGTGFVKTNGDRPGYLARLSELLATRAELTVVQASGNDAVCDPCDVEAAAVDFLGQLSGRVVVLGPPNAIAGVEHLPEITNAVESAAKLAGASFVDVTGWIRLQDLGPDGAHWTAAGHRRFGRLLASALR